MRGFKSETEGLALHCLQEGGELNKSIPTPEGQSEVWMNAVNEMLKQQITLRIDADILDWFRSLGDGYQARINDALRIQMGRDMDKCDN